LKAQHNAIVSNATMRPRRSASCKWVDSKQKPLVFKQPNNVSIRQPEYPDKC
jgi:hypothetical protein